MEWHYNPLSLPILISAVVSAMLALYSWRRRYIPAAKILSLLTFAVAEWSFAYALELGGGNLETKLLWAKFQYIGILIVPTTWLALSFHLSGRKKWLKGNNLFLLAIVPIIIAPLPWTNESHNLIWTSAELRSIDSIIILDVSHGIGFWIYAIYSYLLLIISTILLMWTFLKSSKEYRKQLRIIIFFSIAPWIGNVIYIFELPIFKHIDLTTFGFLISELAVAWTLFRFQIFNIVPVAHEAVIDSMSDGVIVLNSQNTIVDINPVAVRITGLKRTEVIGKSVAPILTERSKFIKEIFNAVISRKEISTDNAGERRYFDMRVSPLYDEINQFQGRIVVLREMTEYKRIEEDFQRRAKELTTLHSVSLDISGPHDLPELLNTIVEKATGLLGGTGGGMYLTNPEKKEVKCVVSFNTPKDYSGTILKYGEGASGVVALTGKPLIIDDYSQWKGRAAVYENVKPFSAVICVPMTWKNQVIGVIIVLHNAKIRYFSQDDADLLTLFANQAAITIENTRLIESLRKRTTELETLRQASLRVTSSLELQQVLGAILDNSLTLISADDAHIFLYDGQRLSFGAALWAGGHQEKPFSEPRKNGLTYQVVTSGKNVIVPDMDDHILFVGQPWKGAIIGLPLIMGTTVHGVMNVAFDAPHDFDQDEIRVLELLADQAAIALVNAQLHADVQTLAITDALTEIYNRRGLFELGRREVERSHRFKRNMSAILFDLDNFKKVNDTYGHAIGDEVLRTVVHRCSEYIREVDILGRYGGEEFVILLPEADQQSAYQIAERLRNAIAEKHITTEKGAIPMTISLGVTEVREETKDLETLIEQADVAMYEAKKAGRNQVSVD